MAKRHKLNKNNSTGYAGVSWSKEKGKWHAKIGVKNRRIHVGYFSDIDDAAQAYEKFKKKYHEKSSERTK